MDTFDLRKYLYHNPLLQEEEVETITKQDVIDIGFTSTSDVDELSFDTSIKNAPTKPGILLHQRIRC